MVAGSITVLIVIAIYLVYSILTTQYIIAEWLSDNDEGPDATLDELKDFFEKELQITILSIKRLDTKRYQIEFRQ